MLRRRYRRTSRRGSIMRKLIVSNFVTLDGYYEGKDKSINSLFDYYHKDYSGDQNFDYYNAERLRTADFLLLSRTAFLSNKGFWPGVATDPNATAVRHEIAGLMSSIEKIVISDNLTAAELAPWKIRASSNGRMRTGRLPHSNSNPAKTSWCS